MERLKSRRQERWWRRGACTLSSSSSIFLFSHFFPLHPGPNAVICPSVESDWGASREIDGKKNKLITIPASHQTVEGYNLKQWRCLLSGEIWSFTRKPHTYKTLLDVPTAWLVSKLHSSGATFNCSMSTRIWGGEEGRSERVQKGMEEKWERKAGRETQQMCLIQTTWHIK